MSIYATNFVVDEMGNPLLIKHLNKKRVDRYSFTAPGGWNKTGKKARINKIYTMASLRVKGKRYHYGRGWNKELYKKFEWKNEI